MKLNEENLESLNKEESNHKKRSSNIKKFIAYGTALAILSAGTSAGTITLLNSLNNNNRNVMRCIEYPIYYEVTVPVYKEEYVYATKYKDGKEYQESVGVRKVMVGTKTEVRVRMEKRFEKIDEESFKKLLDKKFSKPLAKTI